MMSTTDELFDAVREGREDRVAALLEGDPNLVSARNDDGDSLLLAAIYAGQKAVFRMLLDRGVPVNLFEATALGLDERIGALLEKEPAGVREHSHDGWTALHLAAFFGHRDAAALLLDRGAEIDARSKSPRFAKENTPLHAAAANRQTAVAELLIERGADVNARDGSGFTPLGLAANSKNDMLVMVLLAHGARVA